VENRGSLILRAGNQRAGNTTPLRPSSKNVGKGYRDPGNSYFEATARALA
jgi:hypothetical protein